MRKIFLAGIAIGAIALMAVGATLLPNDEGKPTKKYRVIDYPSPNFNPDSVNRVEGVVLHHTAEPTVERSLEVLTSPERGGVSTHVVIDYDGTRYLMFPPEVVAYHAGFSILNGKERCNYFTIGIEFQGNTLERPLTEDQIQSAVEYLLPIMAQYNIPLKNVVTHEMVRMAYKRKYPKKKCYNKNDITQTEYRRVMKALREALDDSQ
ncbi:MAG: N-acetylmuramoyl-L-alanine amidase [Prevotella sp.]|nr:N-acetylmuramoyl-L-alanine amidase [Prevotella sp.]